MMHTTKTISSKSTSSITTAIAILADLGILLRHSCTPSAFFVQISQLKAADTPGTVERPSNPITPSAARLSNIFQMSEEDDYVYYPKKIPLGG
jgi:hypothetical protein